ncbi:phosphoribosylglycinamide formyltransferase [Marinoscillum sp. MHG1-6]|uniref:phosphoribosylglycinamide formyltransferase n=1 Tax=Marinoscillum sp. MHG1-6 TaxID=2959627 RepID=UPI00215828C0|nr:phosphoribosylglycinamide formyltransferase [Marinoscillum sp. MHG1-6]
MDINIAIFASGSGSNAERIIKEFEGTLLKPCVVFCNKPNAFVLERSKKLGVPAVVFNREEFSSENFLDKLSAFKIDFIVLAGFLWKVPEYLIKAYPNKIINIHPALLPKYGGKGMYGSHVHEAVVANGEQETGITIHLVNENYDEGRHIFQAKCPVTPNDTPETVASKIHELEYEHFPAVIAQYISDYKV